MSEAEQERRVATGGCLCGQVRYRVTVAGDAAYYCHCRMCQRATGGVAAPFVSVKQADLHWEREPAWFDSSPIARRAFCPRCGSPLAFTYREGADDLDLTVGSFDEAARFVPTAHFGAESLNEAWLDTRALPRTRSDEHAPLVQRWEKARGAAGE